MALQQPAANIFATIPNNQLLISSFSLSSAMCMAALGTKSDTLQEINEVFQCDHQVFASIVRDMTSQNVTIANAIFPAHDSRMKQTYVDEVKKYYDAEILPQNYTDREEAARSVNAFMSMKTNGRIEEVIKPNDVDASTKAILVNTIDLKFSWVHPFSTELTTSKPFHLVSNEKVMVQMMQLGFISSFLIREYGSEARGIVLRGTIDGMSIESPFSMEFIVPTSEKPDAIFAIENQAFGSPTSEKYTHVDRLEIPKFDLSNLLELKGPLQKLGITKAFTRSANFSGMTEAPGLLITNVLQKTRVTVNEDGVAASAATAVTVAQSAVRIRGEVFVVNRPFIAHIRYKDILLFSMRILDPRQGAM